MREQEQFLTVLDRDDDPVLGRVGDHRRVERAHAARVPHGDGQALFRELDGGLLAHVEHLADADEAHVGAGLDLAGGEALTDLVLADLAGHRLGPADGDGTIVFADFRVTNTAAIPFVVNGVQMSMETSEGEVANAVVFSKSEVEQATKYLKLLGPKYNEVLSIKDKLPAVETSDRMVAGRFNFPPKFLQQRKTLRLRIDELDGIVAEITEPAPGK